MNQNPKLVIQKTSQILEKDQIKVSDQNDLHIRRLNLLDFLFPNIEAIPRYPRHMRKAKGS